MLTHAVFLVCRHGLSRPGFTGSVGTDFADSAFLRINLLISWRERVRKPRSLALFSLELSMLSSEAILLVDDNAVQAAVRQTILRRSGYFVITALNPARALEQLRHGDFLTEIRLVVTDHIMPGMSGTHFVQEVRKVLPRIPILVISGMAAEQEYEGLNVLFQLKPLQPEFMLECVRNLIGQPHAVEHMEASRSLPPVPAR